MEDKVWKVCIASEATYDRWQWLECAVMRRCRLAWWLHQEDGRKEIEFAGVFRKIVTTISLVGLRMLLACKYLLLSENSSLEFCEEADLEGKSGVRPHCNIIKTAVRLVFLDDARRCKTCSGEHLPWDFNFKQTFLSHVAMIYAQESEFNESLPFRSPLPLLNDGRCCNSCPWQASQRGKIRNCQKVSKNIRLLTFSRKKSGFLGGFWAIFAC